jgi:thiol-disulfide isomerase/thioredoxin
MRPALFSLFGAAALFTASAADPVRPAPPFTITRIGDPPVKVSQYKGKVVALAFIYTTCPHCQHLTTLLNQVAKDYAARGVQVLECAFNDDAIPTMPEFLQQFNPHFPVGYATRASVMSYLQISILDSRPLYVPHMVFIDRAGMIRGDYPGEAPFFQDPDVNVRKELDKMLKSAPAATHSASAKK